MDLYPKLPTGPSALGTAQVRALQTAGGDWQRTQRDANTLALKQGEFTKVIVSGVEYVSDGRVSPIKRRTLGTYRYIQPFIPVATQQGGINTGRGVYFGSRRTQVLGGGLATKTYTPVPLTNINYQYREYSSSVAVARGSFYGNFTEIAFYNHWQQFAEQGIVGGESPGFVVGLAPLSFAQYVTDPSGERVLLAPALINDGRVDVQGRILEDLSVNTVRAKGASSSVSYTTTSFTRADAEFSPFIQIVSTGGASFILLAEKFFRAEPVTGGTDYRPKFFLFILPGNNASAPVPLEATGLFNNAKLPTTSFSGPTEYWSPNAGITYNRNLNIMMGIMLSVVLPSNRFLLFARQFCDDDLWHLKIIRVQWDGGGSATGNLVVNLADPAEPFIQSAVHLGEGWVLAKRVDGFGGIDNDVSFMRSSDGGFTWGTFTPTGFSTPLKNQFFGDLIVQRSRKPGVSGSVLMPAWDATSQSHYVYESRDDGATWTRRGRIYKPDEFRRVDTMVEGDGGDNFGRLTPGPDPVRPVDVTLPNRYNP